LAATLTLVHDATGEWHGRLESEWAGATAVAPPQGTTAGARNPARRLDLGRRRLTPHACADHAGTDAGERRIPADPRPAGIACEL